MKFLEVEVEDATPQQFVYTFLDQNRAVIDLTAYATASLVIKQQDVTGSTTVAATITNAAAGTVQSSAWVPAAPGTYYAQFHVTTSGSSKLYGEVLEFVVSQNADEMLPL